MPTTSSTPIWLDLRTEYIDANFESFLTYLYKNHTNPNDSFYKSSLDLLGKRIEEMVQQTSAQPLSDLDTGWADKDDSQSTLFKIRLLGAYLLSNNTSDIFLIRRAFSCQILHLTRVCSINHVEPLTELAISVLTYGGNLVLGYQWDDILQLYPDVLSIKILKHSAIGTATVDNRWYKGLGDAYIAQGKLHIINVDQKQMIPQLQTSISLCNDTVNIQSPQGEKLKQSQLNDYSALKTFTKNYIQKMQAVDLHVGERELKRYYPDPETTVDIKITDSSYDTITAITINPDYTPLRGKIYIKKIFFLTMSDLIKTWKIGDEMPARITKIADDGTAIFDITDEITDYVVSDYVQNDDKLIGTATKVKDGRITTWRTDIGIPVYTNDEAYPIGTTAQLTIIDVAANGYIKAEVDYVEDQPFNDYDAAKCGFLEDFRYDPSNTASPTHTVAIVPIDTADLQIIAKNLFLQQRLTTDPAERYRILCVVQIMSHLYNDTYSCYFVDFLCQYLDNVVFFAQDRTKQMFTPKYADSIANDRAVLRRKRTIDVLKCYADSAADDILIEAIDSDDEYISGLARLVHSCNGLKGVLSESMQNAIKHEILKKLKIDDDSETDLEDEGGAYLGIENGHQEFKTSFVYPPANNMQPNPEVQKKNVFKAICAFMNTDDGGVVYLGVNDLGTVCGVENDMTYLHKTTLDSYMRYINDQIKAEFGLGLLTFIDLQAMYDDRVVAIRVKPCDYKVVEFEGIAYIRTNAESREMTRSVRLRIEEKKRDFDKSKAESINVLQQAISNQRQVIAHGYSSSHGGDRRDRHLEPFSFTSGKTHVWCYDLDDNKVKLFAVSRICNTEITEKTWTATDKHREGNIDIFHMTADQTTEITLEVDRMAYNLLIEEYPDAKRDLTATPQGTWLLQTKICSFYGVGRFYIGLADHITIIDAPELEEYARQYFAKHSGQ